MKNEFENSQMRGRNNSYGYGFGKADSHCDAPNSSMKNDCRSCYPYENFGHQDSCRLGRKAHHNSGAEFAPQKAISWLSNWGIDKEAKQERKYSLANDVVASANNWFRRGIGAMPSLFANKQPSFGRSLWQNPLNRFSFDDSMVVTENDREISIALAIPGCERKDVSVNLRESPGDSAQIEVSWHTSKQSSLGDSHVVWMGKTWESGHRSFPVPEYCNKDDIKADMKHGVLTLQIPKLSAKKTVRSGGKSKPINFC